MEIRNWDDITPLFGARTVDNFEIIILYVNYFELQLTIKKNRQQKFGLVCRYSQVLWF